MRKRTYTCNGQEVDCYGKWEEDSNAFCVFENPGLDGIYADGATSWADAVKRLTSYAKRHNTKLIEMTSC